MAIGTVKWFDTGNGYGFITPDERGEDLFVHQSSIVGNGYPRSPRAPGCRSSARLIPRVRRRSRSGAL